MISEQTVQCAAALIVTDDHRMPLPRPTQSCFRSSRADSEFTESLARCTSRRPSDGQARARVGCMAAAASRTPGPPASLSHSKLGTSDIPMFSRSLSEWSTGRKCCGQAVTVTAARPTSEA